MSPDSDALNCLGRFVRGRDEAAFAEVVRRYAGLVYGVALRRTGGNGPMAEDVSQLVFLELAKHAPRLLERAETRLGGWLHRCALSVTSDLMKSERRRAARENQAGQAADAPGGGREEFGDGSTPWNQCAPMLDLVLQNLGERDRDAVILRFFEGHSFQDIGERLGITEDTAQKRVSRALDKMRTVLRRQGIGSSSSMLASGLAAHAIPPMPCGMADQLTAAVFSGHAAGGWGAGAGLSGFASSGSAAVSVSSSASASGSFSAIKSNLIPTILMKLSRRFLPATALTATVAVLGPLVYWQLNHQSAGPDVSTESGPEKESGAPLAGTVATRPVPGMAKPAAASTETPDAEPAATASTEETRRAELRRTAEARAKERTQLGYDEVMSLLKSKFNLTPSQEEALAQYHQGQRDKWVRFLVGATLHEADPSLYHLEAGYREKIPPQLQSMLTPEQLATYQEWDQRRRTNHVEAISTGELGYLADRLDLSTEQKDRLFASLSGINSTDLFTDLNGIHTLGEIAAQADHDISRRREVFAKDLSADQMEEWEKVVTGYREQLLQRFGGTTGDLATSSVAPTGNSKG